MDSVSFGLGLTGTGAAALALLWYLFAKQRLHSKCLVKGVVVELDIHKATAAEEAIPEPRNSAPIVDDGVASDARRRSVCGVGRIQAEAAYAVPVAGDAKV